jgi:hypothetical protein
MQEAEAEVGKLRHSWGRKLSAFGADAEREMAEAAQRLARARAGEGRVPRSRVAVVQRIAPE